MGTKNKHQRGEKENKVEQKLGSYVEIWGTFPSIVDLAIAIVIEFCCGCVDLDGDIGHAISSESAIWIAIVFVAEIANGIVFGLS